MGPILVIESPAESLIWACRLNSPNAKVSYHYTQLSNQMLAFAITQTCNLKIDRSVVKKFNSENVSKLILKNNIFEPYNKRFTVTELFQEI